MDLLQNLQNIFTGVSSGVSGEGNGASRSGLDSLLRNSSDLLGPAALGGLVGALLTSKAARGVAGGALLAGGGAFLWKKYQERFNQENAGNPQYAQLPSDAEERAKRIIRALVFAAKSDGHIDDAERAAVMREVGKLGFGKDAETVVSQALAEPLDPAALAAGVKNAGEALEIYALSCSVITVDHFMERGYLDALAKALCIPDDVKKDIEAKAGTGS